MAEDPKPEPPPTLEPIAAERWMSAGGWYRLDTALLYRPIGHRDPFLRSWIDLAAGVGPSPGAGQALQIFADLTGRKTPGQCGKCHSVDADADGALTVNWRPKRRAQDIDRFTEYKHLPHFSLVGETGCLACHKVDYEADFMAAFGDLDPTGFVSNFRPMSKQICAACHIKELAGDACTDCHNYHIGRFPPALAAAPLALEGGGAPAAP